MVIYDLLRKAELPLGTLKTHALRENSEKLSRPICERFAWL